MREVVKRSRGSGDGECMVDLKIQLKFFLEAAQIRRR